jgi:flagellar basal body-associated protein FliL
MTSIGLTEIILILAVLTLVLPVAAIIYFVINSSKKDKAI